MGTGTECDVTAENARLLTGAGCVFLQGCESWVLAIAFAGSDSLARTQTAEQGEHTTHTQHTSTQTIIILERPDDGAVSSDISLVGPCA